MGSIYIGVVDIALGSLGGNLFGHAHLISQKGYQNTH